MISMLIYSCKQNEIELLQEISKDIVAYLYDEQLDIAVTNIWNDREIKKIGNIDIALVDITEESGLQAARDLRKYLGKIEIIIISDNTISPVVYLTPDIRPASLLLKPLKEDEIHNGIKGVFNLLEQNRNDDGTFFLFEEDKEQKRVPYSQILYFEARNGRIYIRLQNKEFGICLLYTSPSPRD